MAYTQEQFDAIDTAIAEGALTVKYSDKEVTYRSLDDMLRIRALIAQSLGLASRDDGRNYACFDRGLNFSRDQRNYGEF